MLPHHYPGSRLYTLYVYIYKDKNGGLYVQFYNFEVEKERLAWIRSQTQKGKEMYSQCKTDASENILYTFVYKERETGTRVIDLKNKIFTYCLFFFLFNLELPRCKIGTYVNRQQ